MGSKTVNVPRKKFSAGSWNYMHMLARLHLLQGIA